MIHKIHLSNPKYNPDTNSIEFAGGVNKQIILPLDVQTLAFKDGVADYASLPLSGNVINDARITNDNGHLYVWSGTEWIDQGDIIDATGGDVSNKMNGAGTVPVGNLVEFDSPDGLDVTDSGVSSDAVLDAIDKSHDQDTDTHTNSLSFQIDSNNNGPLLKNNGGGSVAIRLFDDSTYESLLCATLLVEESIADINGSYESTPQEIRDAIDASHDHPNKADLDLVSGTNTGDQDLSNLQNVSDFVDNEILTGSGVDWVLSQTPKPNSEHIYAEGLRLTVGVDYTAVGVTITTTVPHTLLVADYRK